MAEQPNADRSLIEERLRQDLRATIDAVPGAPVTPGLLADTRRLGAAFRAHRLTTTVLLVVAVAVVVVAILLSPALGRAVPAGSYRPPLPPDPIELGCYPLPAGLTLDFPYQVRADGDVHGRRVLTLQWDELDAADVRRRLASALHRAGLPRRAATVTPYPGVGTDEIVRGTVVLRLPVVPLSSDAPACRDPGTTKRFPPGWAPSTEWG